MTLDDVTYITRYTNGTYECASTRVGLLSLMHEHDGVVPKCCIAVERGKEGLSD